MTLTALRAALDRAGVRLIVAGDALRVFAPPGTLTPALRHAITDHKAALIATFTGFSPLDAAIITSEAGKHSLADIARRLARVAARAGAPDATPLDTQLVRDWTAIQTVKVAGRAAA